MRWLKIVLWICCLGMLGSSCSSAATAAFRVICADGDSPDDLRYVPAPDRAAASVRFQMDRFSDIHEYRGGNSVVFFREVVGAAGPPARFTVAMAQIPNHAARVLLVFVPGGDRSRSTEFNVLALPDPEPIAARGTIRFLNLSAAKLLVKLGEENRELAAQHFEDFRFRTTKIERMAYGLAVLRQNEWKIISDSDLVVSRDRRYLMLILPPPATRPDSLRFRLKLLEE